MKMSRQVSLEYFRGIKHMILLGILSLSPSPVFKAFLARVEIESSSLSLFLDVSKVDYAFALTYVQRAFNYKL